MQLLVLNGITAVHQLKTLYAGYGFPGCGNINFNRRGYKAYPASGQHIIKPDKIIRGIIAQRYKRRYIVVEILSLLITFAKVAVARVKRMPYRVAKYLVYTICCCQSGCTRLVELRD